MRVIGVFELYPCEHRATLRSHSIFMHAFSEPKCMHKDSNQAYSSQQPQQKYTTVQQADKSARFNSKAGRQAWENLGVATPLHDS